MCVDEEHIRALAFQAAEWHKLGIKPLGSAVATTHIVNKPDLKTMSKNKKKKLKKKEKQKQKMLELTQQQIQVNSNFIFRKKNKSLFGEFLECRKTKTKSN
jgi:hypothetical protein